MILLRWFIISSLLYHAEQSCGNENVKSFVEFFQFQVKDRDICLKKQLDTKDKNVAYVFTGSQNAFIKRTGEVRSKE